MSRTTPAALVLFACVTAGVRADGPVAIRLKQVGPGETFWADQRSEVEVVMQLTADGKTTRQEQRTGTRFTYRETVREKKLQDRRPTRLEREYERAEVTLQGRSQAFRYQGWTVLIEKEDGRYQFRIKDGDDLAEKDAPFLYREFSEGEAGKVEEEMFLPRKPVAVGESWKIDAKPLIEIFEKGASLGVDAARATATGKLAKLYRREGRQYGVLTVRMELPLTTYTQGGNKVPLKAGSRAVIDATVDLCIDGTALDGKMDLATEVNATSAAPGPDGKEVAMTLTIRNRGKELRADLPKP